MPETTGLLTGSEPRPGQRYYTIVDGPQLRTLRRQHGMSQETLAYRAGIGLTTIARLEHQPRGACRCRTLARLAAALGEPPATITPDPQWADPGLPPQGGLPARRTTNPLRRGDGNIITVGAAQASGQRPRAGLAIRQ